jgi:hypothetical protein
MFQNFITSMIVFCVPPPCRVIHFFPGIVEEHAALIFKVASLSCSSYLNVIIYNCITVNFYCVVFFQLCRSLAYTGCSCCWFSDCVLPVLPVLSLLFAIQKASSWNCLWQ